MENKPAMVVESTGEHIVAGSREALLAVSSKVAWRLMPVIMICYMFAFFDRIIISFAKFQLQADLALSDTAYGVGAGLFSLGYVLFEVPSNMFLYRVGARRWIARIMITWGIFTALTIFVRSEWQTVCSLLAEVARPHDATSEGCSGWAGAEPPAQGTSHAEDKQSVCRSGYLQAEDLGRLGRGRPPG